MTHLVFHVFHVDGSEEAPTLGFLYEGEALGAPDEGLVAAAAVGEGEAAEERALAEVWPEVEAGKHRRVRDDGRTGAVRRDGHRARRTVQDVNLNLVVKPEIKRYSKYSYGACRHDCSSQPQTGRMTEINTSFMEFLLFTNLKYGL